MNYLKISVFLLLTVCHGYAQTNYETREIKKGNIISGTCLFGTVYLACILTAIDGESGTLLIPVIGPFITEGMEGDNPSSPGFYVSLGISRAEAIGIALITTGIIGKKVRNSNVSIFPLFNKDRVGLKLKMNI